MTMNDCCWDDATWTVSGVVLGEIDWEVLGPTLRKRGDVKSSINFVYLILFSLFSIRMER